LNLSNSIRLKFNGSFKRWIYLLDEHDCLYKVRIKIKTAAWFNENTRKWQYVSIFPNFIKRWHQSSLNLLEYTSCIVRKGEDVFWHIDDPKELLLCEDSITGAIKRIEKDIDDINCVALLNSKYTLIFNRPVHFKWFEDVKFMRFETLFSLIVMAKQYF